MRRDVSYLSRKIFRDKQIIEQLKARLTELEYEALRSSELLADLEGNLEIEPCPEPGPHLHPNHEDRAQLYRRTFLIASVFGFLIALYLTVPATTSLLVGALLGVLIYTILKVGLIAGLAQLGHVRFMELSSRIYTAALVFVFLFLSIVLIERLVPAAIAQIILPFDSLIWLGLEIGMVLLGSVSYLGFRYFGWSGRLVRVYEKVQARITKLEERIAIRKLSAAELEDKLPSEEPDSRESKSTSALEEEGVR